MTKFEKGFKQLMRIKSKLGKGFEQFATVKECLDFCEEMTKVRPGPQAYHILTGTPSESLWPVKHTRINGAAYDIVGFGEDRMTQWGALPATIIAVRSDLAASIRGDNVPECVYCSDGWCGKGDSPPAESCCCDGRNLGCGSYTPA